MILTGYAQQTGVPPYEPQLDYGFQSILPVIPRVNSPQNLPATWPPPGFFQSNPRNQPQFQPAFPAISPKGLKDDAQLDQERFEIQNAQNPAPGMGSLLWIAALGAAAYYFYKKGKS